MSVADFSLGVLPNFGANYDNDSVSFQNFSLDEATDQIEFMFFAPVTSSQTITRVGVRCNAVTGTTPDYLVSFQGINSSGRADGTIKGATNSASATITPSAGWITATLTESFTVSPGDALAIVIKYTGVKTINASNFAAFSTRLGTTTVRFPCVLTFNATGSAITRSVGPPVCTLGTASTWYGMAVSNGGTQTFNSGSGTTRYANRFVTDSAWTGTLGVCGARLFIGSGTGAAFDLEFYNGINAGDTTIALTKSVDTDFLSGSGIGFADIYFTPQTINAGSGFRLGCSKASIDTTNLSLNYLDANSASEMDAYPWLQTCYGSSRSTGNWTDATTRRYGIMPLLCDLTAAAGGSIVLPPARKVFSFASRTSRRAPVVIPGPATVSTSYVPISSVRRSVVTRPAVTRRTTLAIPGQGSVVTAYVPIPVRRQPKTCPAVLLPRSTKLIPGATTTVNVPVPFPVRRSRPVPVPQYVRRSRPAFPIAAVTASPQVVISPVRKVR